MPSRGSSLAREDSTVATRTTRESKVKSEEISVDDRSWVSPPDQVVIMRGVRRLPDDARRRTFTSVKRRDAYLTVLHFINGHAILW